MNDLDQSIIARLRTALDADPRADRRICEDANIGPNYIRGIYQEGKAPSVEYLMKILGQLGPAATIFVLTGMELDEQDLELLKIIPKVPADTKGLAVELLRKMQSDEA